MNNTTKPNRLIREKSPYLLQHAYNPVDWFPWGEEAFGKAQNENKPIFLSIGYSTCYWCHVMEREVFENETIAAAMNEHFVCIKVDREELPDVDRTYMAALQAMTGSGGWPLSAFLTPDLKPFYAATYIPPVSQFGKPGFADLIAQIHALWVNSPEKILRTGGEVAQYLEKSAHAESPPAAVSREFFDACVQSFARLYDAEYGGFGGGPKFPRPAALNFLFRYYARTANAQALAMPLETLERMADGGMRDHIGGGFHRYSTDGQWRVPHFEKMLYDQAQLAISYIEAYQITRDERSADVARDVLAYVLREMTSPEGGFYSAQDAESAVDEKTPEKKEEGAYYVWTKREIENVIGAEAAAVFGHRYGVEERGNALRDSQHAFAGKNILYVAHSVAETAATFGIEPQEVRRMLAAAREKLFAARQRRPKPFLDDKILVSWNGLMISAFARAGAALDDDGVRNAAEGAAEFIIGNLFDANAKKLYHRFRDRDARFAADLEDYAFFVQGLIDLYEATAKIRWLQTALEMTERQIENFYDGARGGFFDTQPGASHLLVRTKESYDGAEPSGNSIAILNLLRLARMTDNAEWRAMAEQSLRFFGGAMAANPQAMPQFAVAAEWALAPPQEIVIAGMPENMKTRALRSEVHAHFLPHNVVLFAEGGDGQKTLEAYLPFIKNMSAIGGAPAAYVCENYACQLPLTDPARLREVLGK